MGWTEMNTTEVNIRAVKKWIAAMNGHDADLMGSLCSPEATAREMAEPEPVVGRAGIVEAYKELFVAFPDCSCDVVNLVADERSVVAEVFWRGTSLGEFRRLPCTNKRIELPIAYVFEFMEGYIRKIREYYDGATFLSQMGLTGQKT